MLIDIRSLRLQIRGTPILHDVCLTLAAGEIYGLIGPNGAGKSTTIAATLGLRPICGGTVRVFDRDPSRDAEAIHRRAGVLPEQSGFYDWMTAPDYLAFFASLYGLSPRRGDIAARLASVGLAPGRRQPIGTFSRGMRQRLGLARAMIADPQLLILDEPTNGLDPRGRREIHDLLIDLSGKQGVGILLCTHLLDDVERLCTRIGVIVDGRTVAEGPVSALLARNDQRGRYRIVLSRAVPRPAEEPAGVRIVGHDGDGCIVDLDATVEPWAAWRELLFRGWPIKEIVRAGGGLEDLYLSLTERRVA
jgi:ABC-2 type transport system ATP-binding protein